jgi:hypothetical protein
MSVVAEIALVVLVTLVALVALVALLLLALRGRRALVSHRRAHARRSSEGRDPRAPSAPRMWLSGPHVSAPLMAMRPTIRPPRRIP